MKRIPVTWAGVAALLAMTFCPGAAAQTSRPVRVAFDENSARIELLTGKRLPNYTQAQAGSVRFYVGRLDAPVNEIHYMFAPMVSVPVDNLLLMRKMFPHNIWALVTRSGGVLQGLNPLMTADVVKTYAVSFVPLDPATGRPESRVYVLLKDMYLIEWEDVDHWLAKKSQAEYESEAGTYY